MEKNNLDERVENVVKRFKDFAKEVPKDDYEVRHYYEAIISAAKRAKEANEALEEGELEEEKIIEMLEKVESAFDSYHFHLR